MNAHAVHKKVQHAIPRNRHAVPVLQGARPSTARIFGYGRVSTEDQRLDVQLADFERVGAQEIFVEKVSARNAKRPMFDVMMKSVEAGDTIYFHSLSRFGRGVEATLARLRQLKEWGVEWHSITEPYCDDKTAMGIFMTQQAASRDEFELNQLSERTRRGMAELERQGMWLGRKPKISDADARKMLALRKKGLSAEKIRLRFRRLKVKASTIYSRTNALLRAMRKKKNNGGRAA